MSDNIKAGDRVRLTFSSRDCEYVVTGTLEEAGGYLHVGGWGIEAEDRTVELLAPVWHDALVVQAGGKTFAKSSQVALYPEWWMWVSAPGGERSWFTPDEVAALGPVRVVVDAEGNVVA